MNSKVFLITGSSTGIGEASAISLAKKGHKVFAGVRKKDDGGLLVSKAGDNIIPVILDVTSAESIEAAHQFISNKITDLKRQGLDGLVNNAGIVISGPLEFLRIEALRLQFEVNVTGVLAVTQKFLPLIRVATGRIVNMGSLSGLLAVPFVGPYSASKFALRGLTDSLRIELSPWKIRVSLIEPGPIATPIWEKSKKTATDLFKDLSSDFDKYYKEILDRFKIVLEREAGNAVSVEVVVKAVEHALEASSPRLYYPVGRGARVQSALSHLIPQVFMDKVISKGAGF